MATPEIDKLEARSKVAPALKQYAVELQSINARVVAIKTALTNTKALMQADTDYFPAASVTEIDALITIADNLSKVVVVIP